MFKVWLEKHVPPGTFKFVLGASPGTFKFVLGASHLTGIRKLETAVTQETRDRRHEAGVRNVLESMVSV